jgi:hypothetical protein
MMAVVAGLLLNLTPCVLPAIPIKVRTILREAGSQRSHRQLVALMVGFAVATWLDLPIPVPAFAWHHLICPLPWIWTVPIHHKSLDPKGNFKDTVCTEL